MSRTNLINPASNTALAASTAIGATGGGAGVLVVKYASMGMGAKLLSAVGIGGLSVLSPPVIVGAMLGAVAAGALAYALTRGKSLIRVAEEAARRGGFRDGPE